MKIVLIIIGIIVLLILGFMVYRYFAFNKESAQMHELRFERIKPIHQKLEKGQEIKKRRCS